ncbi:UBX domain-containing protein 11 isoform X2 [Macrotis lagotis]|uniref:UBX domain-containing protein 11 isoform X2 n=1 Tax=Macrotis lagotis TaxID=92651 RepID=UPI003D68E424
MTSPLASLSKTRRVPLQSDIQNSGGPPLPSRMKVFSEDEEDLLNDEFNEEKILALDSTQEKPLDLRRCGSLPQDMGLVSSMVKRLNELEEKVKKQAKEINLKDQWIKSLKLKIKSLQPIEDRRNLSPTEELEAKCQHLQNQVNEMERFLNDYGLEWVGEPSETEMEMDTDIEAEKWTLKKHWKPGESTVPAPTVDFDELLENLQDLSLLAGEGQSLIHTSSSMAVLKTPEPVPLTLYQNGIIMFNGPFRPFSDVSTQQCIQDILDGFFPSELKKIYPSGVPFKVTDRHNVVYQEQQRPKVFSGPGYVLGKMSTKENQKWTETSGPDNYLPFWGNTVSHSSTISKERFLKKLPKFVIRHGEVIEVREPIRETLGGYSGYQEILVETESPGPQGDLAGAPRLRQSPRGMPTATLRIKSENGEQTFVLPMSPLDTIGDVRRYLARARDRDPASFEIFTAFPPTVYTDDSKTLQACGLVPNAILLLRLPKTPPSALSL